VPGQVFMVRNSWGDRWGYKGHGFLPYAEVARQLGFPRGAAADAWAMVDMRKARMFAMHTPEGQPLVTGPAR
jgi:C1A family cysteine protease